MSSSLHLSVVVARPAGDVYAYAADPAHLPAWAAGLASGVEPRGDGSWVAQSPMGEVVVTFVPPNDLGVLDHVVTLPDGTSVLNPLRVLPHDDGAEVVFTLRPAPGSTPEAFAADAALVRADLRRLKEVLEQGA
ncbi:MAG: hypothetical protein JWN17_1581 [Frankiales bacterium]|nr:hypothetical protein [Frankiales bacterium]